jgi:hypothetical protein
MCLIYSDGTDSNYFGTQVFGKHVHVTDISYKHARYACYVTEHHIFFLW